MADIINLNTSTKLAFTSANKEFNRIKAKETSVDKRITVLDRKTTTNSNSISNINITLGKVSRVIKAVSANYSVTNSDRILECTNSIVILLPLLSAINHYEDIDIVNSGEDNITINTSNEELIYDTTSFVLYPGEVLSIIKGGNKYLVV